MPRSSLTRPLTGSVIALAVALGAASTASASDATLKQTVVSLDKKYEKRSAKITFPEDDSPTFAKDFGAASKKVQGLMKAYRSELAKERGSTSRGRKARTLLLSSADDLRVGFKRYTAIVVRLSPGTGPAPDPTPDDAQATKAASDLIERAEKDSKRGYKLLGLKAPKSSVPAHM